MNAGMKLLAAAGATIVCAAAPAAAQAATTVTVTGDTGAATPLTERSHSACATQKPRRAYSRNVRSSFVRSPGQRGP